MASSTCPGVSQDHVFKAVLNKVNPALRCALVQAELDDPGLLRSFPRTTWTGLATAERLCFVATGSWSTSPIPAPISVPFSVPSSPSLPVVPVMECGSVFGGGPGVVVGTGIDDRSIIPLSSSVSRVCGVVSVSVTDVPNETCCALSGTVQCLSTDRSVEPAHGFGADGSTGRVEPRNDGLVHFSSNSTSFPACPLATATSPTSSSDARNDTHTTVSHDVYSTATSTSPPSTLCSTKVAHPRTIATPPDASHGPLQGNSVIAPQLAKSLGRMSKANLRKARKSAPRRAGAHDGQSASFLGGNFEGREFQDLSQRPVRSSRFPNSEKAVQSESMAADPGLKVITECEGPESMVPEQSVEQVVMDSGHEQADGSLSLSERGCESLTVFPEVPTFAQPLATSTSPTCSHNDTNTAGPYDTPDAYVSRATLSTTPSACPTECDASNFQPTQPRIVHEPPTIPNTEAPPVSRSSEQRRTLGSRERKVACNVMAANLVLRDGVPDGLSSSQAAQGSASLSVTVARSLMDDDDKKHLWVEATGGSAVSDACTMPEGVAEVLRDVPATVRDVTEVALYPRKLCTGRDGSAAVSEGVAKLSMDESSVLRDGSSQTIWYVPSDAQLLYWTLVDDQVVPDGFLSDFERLMAVVNGASDRQARASFMDNPQAALYLHELAKSKESENKKAKSADDQFALALNTKPKKYRTRFERTLYSGPTPRKDAEEVERSRWIHILATLVMGTPTPVGALLQANPGDFQYLGAGRQLAVLRSLSQPELQDPLGESDTVIEFAEYLTTLTGEEEHKAKILRTLERCPRLLPSRLDSLSTQLPDLEEHQEVPYVEEESEPVITELEAKRKRGGHAQVRTQELGTDPRARRQEIRASLRPGFYVCYSGKKSIRTLHKLGLCYALPDVDYIRYEYMGTDFPAGAFDVICKLCSGRTSQILMTALIMLSLPLRLTENPNERRE